MGSEKLDRDDLAVRDGGNTRGNEIKLKRSVCRKDIKKSSSPPRAVGIGNDLEIEIVNAETICMVTLRSVVASQNVLYGNI